MECMRDVMIIEILIQYSVPTYIYIHGEIEHELLLLLRESSIIINIIMVDKVPTTEFPFQYIYKTEKAGF